MFNFLFALSETEPQDNQLWYLYPIFLIIVIVITAFLLSLIKKGSDLKEAERNYKRAITTLKKPTNTVYKKRRALNIANNQLKASEYYYNRCIEDDDMFELSARVDQINQARLLLANHPVETEQDVLLIELDEIRNNALLTLEIKKDN